MDANPYDFEDLANGLRFVLEDPEVQQVNFTRAQAIAAMAALNVCVTIARERKRHSSPLAPVAADPGGPPPPNPSAQGEL